MINTIKELSRVIRIDREKNNMKVDIEYIKKFLVHDHLYINWKYIKMLRIEEYLTNKRGFIFKIINIYYKRKRNKLGIKLGFTIPSNVFSEGLVIWHYGNIVVNGFSKVGKNCILHGDNCIGNNGLDINSPIIGDNVDIGVGAKIIGNVKIANGIIIGANSVVTNSFDEENIIIAGVPAKKIKNRIDI